MADLEAVTLETTASPDPIRAADPAYVDAPVFRDPEDSVLAAHLRRQRDWEEDAKTIFKGPNAEELERIKLLDDLSAIDTRNRLKQQARDAKKKAAEEKACAAEALAAAKARQDAIRDEGKNLAAEIKRLSALV